MANSTNAKTQGAKLVFCKFIVKNGKKIYPKKGKVFRFWVRTDSAA